MEIEDLDSYNLFQEINDRLLVLSGFIKKVDNGLAVKETFVISKTDEVLLLNEKTEEDRNFVLKWITNECTELIEKMKDCIKITNQNFLKFKSENPTSKEEVKMREKDLKKAIRYLENISFEPLTFEDFSNLKLGPEINADYAGISVKETKYFLM